MPNLFGPAHLLIITNVHYEDTTSKEMPFNDLIVITICVSSVWVRKYTANVCSVDWDFFFSLRFLEGSAYELYLIWYKSQFWFCYIFS